jgi:phage gpG-like protein
MADVFVNLAQRLENPRPLLKQLGLLGVKASRDAFRKQRFGDIPWSAKYNDAGSPFINVAGAIEDFNAGKNPKLANLVSRPALIGEGDRGGLRASIDYQVTGADGVEIGSNKPYASLMNRGGNTSVTLSLSGYAKLTDWIGRKRKVRAGGVSRPQSDYANNVFIKHIVKSGAPYVHAIRVKARPFIGFTDELMEDIVDAVQRYFGDGSKAEVVK